MNQEEFTVSFSNFSSLDLFPQNSLSRFTFRLPTPIDLRNEIWEVALVGFTYPNTWFKVRNASEIITHKEHLSVGFPNAEINLHGDILCKYGPSMNFKTFLYGRGAMRHLVTHKGATIFESIACFSIPLTEEYHSLGPTLYKLIRDSEDLQLINSLLAGGTSYLNADGKVEKFEDISGISYNLVKTPSQQLITSNLLEKGADLWRVDLFVQAKLEDEIILPIPASDKVRSLPYLPAIFVYAEQLVEFQNVGDKLRPLLGFVPFTGDGIEDVVKFAPRHRRFHRLVQGYISEITIELKDVFGDSLVFKSGEVTLELQFRKCR